MNKTADFKNVIVCREKLSPFWIAQWTNGRGKRVRRLTITKGWNAVTAAANWRTMPYIGIQATGNTPCTILALQLD